MKKSNILLLGIVILLLLIISINTTNSKLTKLMAPPMGGITVKFTGFGTSASDATLGKINYSVSSVFRSIPSTTQRYNLYKLSSGDVSEYYIADSTTSSEEQCVPVGDGESCIAYNYVEYSNIQNNPIINNISDGDVIIGTDFVGLTSYIVSLDTTTPSPYWSIDSSNIIHINSSETTMLQIPFTHNIIDGAKIITNYQKYNIMKIQLPNSSSAKQTWLGPASIGIQGQPPKFITQDFPIGEIIYIFPWEIGFTPSNPNISILLKEKTNYGKDGQTGDGSVFINDAYSKGYRTCNIIEVKGGYCRWNGNYKYGTAIQCTQSGLPTITSDFITESGCLY